MIFKKGAIMKKKHFSFSTTQIIMFTFLAAILIGSILLSLPISSASGKSVAYIDALFTATTSTCVTGLVTVPTFSTWSTFGHIVILFLIQIGGLGIITIMSGIMIALHKKIGIADRLLIQDAFNLNTLSGLVKFVKKVILGTFIVEGTGALLYMTVFVPQFGLKGIWFSVFNSVSAFCNAGIDIISADSLCGYATNPMINIVTSLLIIISGLGYIVWWDLIRVFTNFRTKKFRCIKNLTLHSKIVLSSTLVFIFAGAILIFIFEYKNPLTIEKFSLFDKIQVSLFQSVTTRTAGFASVPQENLTNATSIICLMLMFIGGSPVGTAGGIKTVTIVVLLASAFSAIRNKDEVTLFNRNIPKSAISKAVSVTSMSFIIMFVSTVLLSAVTDASALDIVYETVSATATVGLTKNLTPYLDMWGKIIIIATMYLGRVGPISLAIAFNMKKEKKNIIKNPTEDISVG
ncbi:MAG: potassium transporter KtrB [Ruminococcaceae bacterium]|nr:potassium transporter KtrB [Oscillospiraceae bacterium]